MLQYSITKYKKGRGYGGNGQIGYPATIIMPFSTSLVDDAESLRLHVEKRQQVKEDSDLLLTQIQAIDNKRFIEKLGSL